MTTDRDTLTTEQRQKMHFVMFLDHDPQRAALEWDQFVAEQPAIRAETDTHDEHDLGSRL